MKKRLLYSVLALVLFFSVITVACAGPAPTSPATPATPATPVTPATPPAPAMPSVLTLATMPPGTVVNTAGVAVIGAITNHTPIKVNLVPATNEMAWVPQLASGEADLGIATSFPMLSAYTATFVFEGLAKKTGIKSFPVRLIACGSWITSAWVVRGDNKAKTGADVKGQRVLWYPDGTYGYLGTIGRLAMDNITPDDITKVPISNQVEGARALIEGRLDVADIGIGAPAATEAVASVNMRYLPATTTPDALERMHKWGPVFYPLDIPGGVYPGVPQPIPLLVFDTYIVARASLGDDAVYQIVKALYENNSEVTSTPALRLWTKDRFVTENGYIPYHPGAIKFYKDKSLWTAKAEQRNQTVLAQEPK